MTYVQQVSASTAWVGVYDPDLRIFDVIVPTDWGTTYNAYLIKGEKIALVETSKQAFADTYIDNIRSLVDPAAIDYIILNHTEPDHTGALAQLLEVARSLKSLAVEQPSDLPRPSLIRSLLLKL